MLTAGDLLTGQQLGELLGPTGGILGGHHPQLNIIVAEQGLLQGLNGLRLIVFNANQHLLRLQQVH